MLLLQKIKTSFTLVYPSSQAQRPVRKTSNQSKRGSLQTIYPIKMIKTEQRSGTLLRIFTQNPPIYYSATTCSKQSLYTRAIRLINGTGIFHIWFYLYRNSSFFLNTYITFFINKQFMNYKQNTASLQKSLSAAGEE